MGLKKILFLVLVSFFFGSCGDQSSQGLSVFKGKKVEYVTNKPGSQKMLAFDKRTHESYIFTKTFGWLKIQEEAVQELGTVFFHMEKVLSQYGSVENIPDAVRREMAEQSLDFFDRERVPQEALEVLTVSVVSRKKYVLNLTLLPANREPTELHYRVSKFLGEGLGGPVKGAEVEKGSYALHLMHIYRSLCQTEWFKGYVKPTLTRLLTLDEDSEEDSEEDDEGDENLEGLDPRENPHGEEVAQLINEAAALQHMMDLAAADWATRIEEKKTRVLVISRMTEEAFERKVARRADALEQRALRDNPRTFTITDRGVIAEVMRTVEAEEAAEGV